jgi:hypothetical protein
MLTEAHLYAAIALAATTNFFADFVVLLLPRL